MNWELSFYFKISMNFIEIQDSELLFSLCKSIKHSILVFFLFICGFSNLVWYAKQVSKLGFECMGLAGVYNSPLSDEDGISVLKDDFNKGITFLIQQMYIELPNHSV